MKKKISYTVSRKRSFLKTITWRVIASLDTFIIVWIITGQLYWASSVAGLEIITKTVLFYLHERGWNYITWGKYINGRALPWWYVKILSSIRKKNV